MRWHLCSLAADNLHDTHLWRDSGIVLGGIDAAAETGLRGSGSTSPECKPSRS